MTATGSPFNNKRITRYRKANILFPHARKKELEIIESILPKEDITSVLEIGSGAGFLTKQLLMKGLTVDTIDPNGRCITGVRNHYQKDVKTALSQISEVLRYDLLISLASFHHIVEFAECFQDQLINDISRITSPNSFMLIIDVPSQKDEIPSKCMLSKIASSHTNEFFRSIVDRYSVPFHNGVYLKTNSIEAQFGKQGWKPLLRQNIYCPWSFNSMQDLNRFVSLLFNIEQIEKIPSYRNIIQKMIVKKTRCVELQWGLSALLMRRY